MEVALIITTVVLGFTGVVMQFMNATRFLHFFHLLLGSTIGLVLLSSLDQGSSSVVFALIGISALNFVFSRWSMLRGALFRLIFPVVSVAGFIFLFQDQSIVLLEGQYVLVNKFLIAAMIIACSAFEIASLKYKLYGRLFSELGKEVTVSSILILCFEFSSHENFSYLYSVFLGYENNFLKIKLIF